MTDEAVATATETAPAASNFKTRAVPSDTPVVEVPSAEPDKPAAPVPDEAKPTESQADPDEPDTEAGDEQPPERAPLPKGVQRKINKLTRRLGESAEQLRDMQERLAQYEQGQVQQKPADVPSATTESDREPTVEDFDFDQAAFNRAHFKWLSDQERKQEAAQTRVRSLQEKEKTFAETHPDYFELTRAPEVPFTKTVVELMAETDNPAAVAYHLASNLELAADIARMTPTAAARAIGRIEAQLDKPAPAAPRELPKKTTNAPPPPKTVSGAGRPEVTVDDPDISPAQRIALWKKAGKR